LNYSHAPLHSPLTNQLKISTTSDTSCSQNQLESVTTSLSHDQLSSHIDSIAFQPDPISLPPSPSTTPVTQPSTPSPFTISSNPQTLSTSSSLHDSIINFTHKLFFIKFVPEGTLQARW